jgi:hypothetical protein
VYVAVLDTNVLLSLSPSEFSLLVAGEKQSAVRQSADLWTIMELIAHLRDINDPRYLASRKALGRCVERALPENLPPQVIPPMQLQVARILFGEPTLLQRENVDVHISLARAIASASDSDDLATLHEGIHSVAEHLETTEKWFSEYFGDLRRQIIECTKHMSKRDRNAAVRAYVRSEEARRDDAAALVARAFQEAGLPVPDPIPEEAIDQVLPLSRPGSHAVGVLIERIICDDAGLEKSCIRNLLWDQEVAGSLGQTINALPVLLVTSDKYFKEAAERVGYKQGVCGPEEYLRRLADP